MRRPIAIIGLAESASQAPFTRDWETWGLAKDANHGARCEALFEMHGLDLLEDLPINNGGRYMERLKEIDVPLYMRDEDERFPASVAYPFEEVEDDVFWCVPEDERYGSQVSYMLALAITKQPPMIGLWGVDLKYDRDHQRHNLAMLAGIAMGREIEVVKPKESNLMTLDYPGPLYTLSGKAVSFYPHYGVPA